MNGTNAGEFVATGLSATTLAPSETATFTVTFTPDAAGTRTAAIHVASNDDEQFGREYNRRVEFKVLQFKQ